MGLDRFANFLLRSTNMDAIEEINIDSNIRKIVTNHVIFDINFLIYQEIIEIENEINDIIKLILCLPFSLNNEKLLEDAIKNRFTKSYWEFCINDLDNIFDGFNEDEIVKNFIECMTSTIRLTNENTNTEVVNPLFSSFSRIELVVYQRICSVLIDYINKLHEVNLIQTISLFYDGIPSISKVFEQRRRRIKNYIESVEKKVLFKTHFEDLLPSCRNISQNLHKPCPELESANLLFDYFKWVKYRFSIDKSVGPSSDFMKKLEKFVEVKVSQTFPNTKLFISSSAVNGESDMKIFKHISMSETVGECCIHTTDSDLIHQMLVQQVYYKIVNRDINLSVIKYLKNFNSIGYAHVLDCNSIIKNIMDLYSNINNTKVTNYKIIWDLCLLFYMFGNDHLMSSVEVGPELGLEYFLKKHFQALNRETIVSIKKTHITLDLANLSSLFKEIDETRELNITKIILMRFFKINFQLVSILVDKLSLNFSEIQKFLKVFIINRGLNLTDEEMNSIDNNDLRKVLLKNIQSSNPDSIRMYSNFSILEWDESKMKILDMSIKLISDNINYYEEEYNGLVLYTKPYNITQDPYQDLYNFISDKASQTLGIKYPQYYDHLDINNYFKLVDSLHVSGNSYDYLKKIYHLCITQFGTMKDYHSDNLTFYKYYSVPSISNMIKFIDTIQPNVNQTKVWFKEISEENIDPDKYLNSISHHLLITPFIGSYSVPEEISRIIEEMKNIDKDTKIDNLWFSSIDTYKYRDTNIRAFFKAWTDALIRVNLGNKTNNVNRELVLLS